MKRTLSFLTRRQPSRPAGAGLVVALLLAGGCGDRRKPISVKGDGGPSVVVVDPRKASPPPSLPPVALVDESEPDDDQQHAQPIESQKGIRGTISAPKPGRGKQLVGDVDWYTWVEPGGAASPDGGAGGELHEARIELTGVPGVDLSLEALDGDGKRLVVASEGAVGEGEIIPSLVLEAGRSYYLRVRALNPVEGAAPYQLVVRSQPLQPGSEREPNDDAAHATPLPSISDATGSYGRRRDEDWLRLPPSPIPGGTLRAELSPVDGVAPLLRIVTADATNPKVAPVVLAEAKGSKGDELRMRNAPLPANGFVVVKAQEGKNLDVKWTLKLYAEPPLDGAEREPNDTVAQANALAFQGQAEVSGFLWPGDADVYRVTGVQPDALVTVTLDPLERVDLRLERLAPDGKSLVKADDGGAGKGERLPPWPGGDVILRVSGKPRDTAFDQPYHLVVSAQPGDRDIEREPNNTRESATAWLAGPLTEGRGAEGAVSVAPSMRGWLAPKGDEDWYRIQVPSGKSKVTVVASPPSLAVRILDENKAPIGPAEPNGRASGPVAAGHAYFVDVRTASDKAAPSSDPYTLTLSLE